MFETVFETQRLAPVSSTEFFRAADAFYERRREGTISFHPKSTTDLRSGVEKQHSGGEVQRSTFARFSGSLDFRLLQQYPPKADIPARSDRLDVRRDIRWEAGEPSAMDDSCPRDEAGWGRRMSIARGR